jgi:hypothetical protein
VHHIIHLKPTVCLRGRTPVIGFVALRQTLQARDEKRGMEDLLREYVNAQESEKDFLFENMFQIIPCFRNRPDFSIRILGKRKQFNLPLPFRFELCFPIKERYLETMEPNILYRCPPYAAAYNYCGVLCDGKNAMVMSIQVTTQSDHTVSDRGIEMLKNIMCINNPYNYKCTIDEWVVLRGKNLYHVFIVPQNLVENFSIKQYENTRGETVGHTLESLKRLGITVIVVGFDAEAELGKSIRS